MIKEYKIVSLNILFDVLNNNNNNNLEKNGGMRKIKIKDTIR